MSVSDYIQLGLAGIAAVGVILSLLNIRLTNQQIKSQHKQWEFSFKPQFKFKYMDAKLTKPFFVFEETSGNPYYVENVTFTTEDVRIAKSFHGTAKQKVVWNEDGTTEVREKEYEGFIVILEPQHSGTISGFIQLSGLDALGNQFKRNSALIKFHNKKLDNHLKITNTFLSEV